MSQAVFLGDLLIFHYWSFFALDVKKIFNITLKVIKNMSLVTEVYDARFLRTLFINIDQLLNNQTGT